MKNIAVNLTIYERIERLESYEGKEDTTDITAFGSLTAHVLVQPSCPFGS